MFALKIFAHHILLKRFLHLDKVSKFKLHNLESCNLHNNMSWEISLIESLSDHDGDAEDSLIKKMALYFTYESRDTLKLFTLFITVKTFTTLYLGHSNKLEIRIYKISCRGSRSPGKAEFGHFTLLFCRVR